MTHDNQMTTQAPTVRGLAIRLDGPPGPEPGRFVEVELDGASVNAGEWVRDGDDWLLALRPDVLVNASPLAAFVRGLADASPMPDDWRPWDERGDRNAWHRRQSDGSVREVNVDESNSGDVEDWAQAVAEWELAKAARKALRDAQGGA